MTRMGLLLKPPSEDSLERAARGLLSLTLSEYLVLRALLAGLKSEEIALETGLTKLTVQFYLKTIFKKCGCDRISLVRMAPKLECNDAVASYLKSLLSGVRAPNLATVIFSEPGAPADKPKADGGRFAGRQTQSSERLKQRRPFRRQRATGALDR